VLYPADSSGEAITGSPIWLGSFPEQLNLNREFTEFDVTPTGATFPEKRRVPGFHEISLRCLWALRAQDFADYNPDEDAAYVLEIFFQYDRPDAWYKRTYYGVRAQGWQSQSEGVMEFFADLKLTATHFITSSGSGAYTPTAVAGGHDLSLFTRPGVADLAAYLLGHYQWDENRVGVNAKVIAQAGSGGNTVLTLEIGGVLSSYALTIPSGSGEVTATVDLTALSIPVATACRWKVTTAPLSGQASAVCIVMETRE